MSKWTGFLLLIFLHAFPLSKTFASETLFLIVKERDWFREEDKPSYCPESLPKVGFIRLLTPELVISTANIFFAGEKDLLLLQLEVASTDPLLKWELEPGSQVSIPHYYGKLPRQFVQKIDDFLPQKDGQFVFPPPSLKKRIAALAVPKGLVNKLLQYQDWQKIDRFQRLQTDNFAKPKVQLQWWYFDFFLQDGSTVVLAFIPQLWWGEKGSNGEKNSLLMMSLITSEGEVKRFTKIIPQSELKTSSDHLEISSRLWIQATGSDQNRTYAVRVHFPEVAAQFDITATRPPFAAFPTGVMPGIFGTVISGAPVGSPRFSYVSQVPNGTVTGSLTWGNYQRNFRGQAYHEQGRQNDTPERQGGYWTWYHFVAEGWNIFGSPGKFIYLQKGNEVLLSGFHLIAKEYKIMNRTLTSPDHPKILTGGEIHFHHQNISLALKLNPSTTKTLIAFPSPDPNQIWGTVEGPATLVVSEGSEKKTIKGRMMLESCAWEVNDPRQKNKQQRKSNESPAVSSANQTGK